MATKLIYFQPKKLRSSNEMIDLDQLFTYEILDKSIQASTKITVPVNLTVFNEQEPSGSSNPPGNGKKICVFLVGSEQCPDNINMSSPVDRIEFHGSIGYEKPLFEMIHRLPGVKKVSFFLGHKQLHHFQECDDKNSWISESVTSLKIVVEKIINNKTSDEMEDHQIVFEKIILRILKRSVTSFPSLRKLTMDVPNSNKVKNAVIGVIEKLQHLKATLVKCNESTDRLIVGKIESPPPSTYSGTEYPLSTETLVSDNNKDVLRSSDQRDKDGKSEVSDFSGSEQSNSTLTGLGKLLESMLGIGLGMTMAIKPIDSDSNLSTVIPVLSELNPVQQIPIVSNQEDATEMCVDEEENYDAMIDDLDKTSSYKYDKDEFTEDEISDDSMEETLSAIRDDDSIEDQEVQESQDYEDALEGTDIMAKQYQHYQPMFHHPLCHDYHQYLGVPIIPGFGIGVYHYPLQQVDGTDGISNEFENHVVEDKGR